MRLLNPVAIILDTSPLGLLTQRGGHANGDACRAWERKLRALGCRFFVPEIADYETRRELVRMKNSDALARLDAYISATDDRYLPLTTPAVRLACDLWAELRQTGRPTASPDALDGDVLISAQARLVVPAGYGLSTVVIATENMGHMTTIANVGAFPRVAAERWSEIGF